MISKYKSKQRKELQRKAFELYKSGLSLRQVAVAVNRSHTWVANAIKEQSGVCA